MLVCRADNLKGSISVTCNVYRRDTTWSYVLSVQDNCYCKPACRLSILHWLVALSQPLTLVSAIAILLACRRVMSAEEQQVRLKPAKRPGKTRKHPASDARQFAQLLRRLRRLLRRPPLDASAVGSGRLTAAESCGNFAVLCGIPMASTK